MIGYFLVAIGALVLLACWMFFGRPNKTYLKAEGSTPVDTYGNGAFRRAGDPDHIIRYPSRRPDGLQHKSGNYIRVRGITFHQGTLTALAAHDPSWLELEPERDHPKDPNAVKVVGYWNDETGVARSGPLGYLPQGVASEVLARERYGAVVRMIRLPRAGKTGSLTIDVWTTSQQAPPKRA